LVWWINDECFIDVAFARRREKIFAVLVVRHDHVDEHIEAECERERPSRVFEDLPVVHLGHSLSTETFFDDFDVFSLREHKEQHEIPDHDRGCDPEFDGAEAVIEARCDQRSGSVWVKTKFLPLRGLDCILSEAGPRRFVGDGKLYFSAASKLEIKGREQCGQHKNEQKQAIKKLTDC